MSNRTNQIYDLTLQITPSLIVWPGDPAIDLHRVAKMEEGDVCNVTRMNISVHTGTHLDAPSHFIADGTHVESLDLQTLVGPALVVDVGDATEITAVLLDSLNIPANTTRLLIKTTNSARWVKGETSFYEPYVAVTADGAQWLVDHGVKLVGVDYLSVAPYSDLIVPHQILLGAKVIPVEGLNLHEITPGEYQFICLPMLIKGSDGAPCRAILIDL